MIVSMNPYNGEVLKRFSPDEGPALEAKLCRAEQAFQAYRRTSFAQRGQWLQRVADLLEQRQADYARLMTLEMGKPINQARGEVKKSAWVCRFYAEKAASFLADEGVETDARRSFIRYQPLGAILAVMPWNFPFWQVFRFAAPALMAGNVGLLKHASNVPQCAQALADLFLDAGFPEGVFQALFISGSEASALMADDRIKAAALTGSEAAGASLASAAGQQIKKTVLELGGSDPFIVLESADLEQAVQVAVMARLQNNGQSCIAAKRFIVQATVADQFFSQLCQRFQALNIGDPLEETTNIGPLANAQILADLDTQVQQTIQAGATLLCGGHPLDGPGYFYPPTVITDISSQAPTYREEFFGPVALGFRVNTMEEAIALANDVPFGLGACAWTQNPVEQEQLIDELEAGAVFINGMVKSDPRLPFGGIKRSGFGRELGRAGILEFVNTKTAWLA
ncbi:NAD-dependent succinate-semialdehyde dehydrogenase [Synechocystis sp. LKSZ1]|uniref:NAD-dependent succinate-semialdehyde dehydrogenase n=1 Tax=Synechocystis sp. LKSZ1 TaxID=3144951 RepID=UPI00336BBD2A